MNDGDKEVDEKEFKELSARLVHDVSTPMAIARMNNDFLARHLPTLLEAYRNQLAEQTNPQPISAEHLDAIARAPALVQEQCARVEETVRMYWRAVNRRDSPAPSAGSRVSQPAATPVRILLVEDETIHQQIAIKVLSPTYQVDVADSGQEALTKCESEPYDLVLLDICLPDLDGRQLTRQLRRTHPRELNIIALSNMPISESELQQAGFDGQLEKPLKLEAFTQCLRGAQVQPRRESRA